MQEYHPKNLPSPTTTTSPKRRTRERKQLLPRRKEESSIANIATLMGMMKKVVGSCILNKGQSIMEEKRRKRPLQQRNEIWVLSQVTKPGLQPWECKVTKLLILFQVLLMFLKKMIKEEVSCFTSKLCLSIQRLKHYLIRVLK